MIIIYQRAIFRDYQFRSVVLRPTIQNWLVDCSPATEFVASLAGQVSACCPGRAISLARLLPRPQIRASGRSSQPVDSSPPECWPRSPGVRCPVSRSVGDERTNTFTVVATITNPACVLCRVRRLQSWPAGVCGGVLLWQCSSRADLVAALILAVDEPRCWILGETRASTRPGATHYGFWPPLRPPAESQATASGVQSCVHGGCWQRTGRSPTLLVSVYSGVGGR